MAKVLTRLHQDGDKVHIERAQDCQAILDSAAELRSNGVTGSGDFRHVGRIPAAVLEMWLNQEGVLFSDTEAVKEVIRKKLQSGDFGKLRVDERTW
tara:strand:+ start:626 stop:913 length:288 start_codon:yes stop_codon:yes gene_type:complete